MSFEHNSVRKNLFLSTSFCWDSGFSSCVMDQKFEFGGLIGYGNSWLDSVFRYSKVFRLHAILPDAAGALRSHSGKGAGYCYMIGREPNSCLLGHVDGLIFCFYLKLFLPPMFKSFDFSSSMSLIVLDIELTEKNINKKIGLFLMVLSKDFHFVPQRLLNLTNRQHGTQVGYMELRGVKEGWTLISFLLSFTT